MSAGTDGTTDHDVGATISNGGETRTDTGNGNRTRSCADTDMLSDGQADMAADTGGGAGSDTNTVTGVVDGGAGDEAEVAAVANPGKCACGGRSGGANGVPNSGVDADMSAGTGLGRAFADICVIVQVDTATGELVAQLHDGERLPASVLDKLTCNARVSVILSNSRGQPIWSAVASRTATEKQRRLLLTRWGGCFHCAAHPAMCQIHHIVPVAQGGETKIDNMIPVCWECHHLIHDNHWKSKNAPTATTPCTHPSNATTHPRTPPNGPCSSRKRERISNNQSQTQKAEGHLFWIRGLFRRDEPALLGSIHLSAHVEGRYQSGEFEIDLGHARLKRLKTGLHLLLKTCDPVVGSVNPVVHIVQARVEGCVLVVDAVVDVTESGLRGGQREGEQRDDGRAEQRLERILNELLQHTTTDTGPLSR